MTFKNGEVFIMYVTPINSYNYNSKRFANTAKGNTSFTGYNSNAFSEKASRSVEYGFRIIGNKFSDLFEGKKIKQLTKSISEITPEANERYLSQLNLISRFYATNKDIEVNIEDKILERIAQKGKSTIFIMNHSNQHQDPSMLAVLNMLLSEAYQYAGKGDKFPLPKIILNQDILTTMNPTKRKAFEAFGAVGIDASVKGGDKAFNARAFLPLIKDFIKDKCNIFIFPEGKLAVRNDLPFEERFQSGIAEMINKILGIKKEVMVVPVGFSYGKGEFKNLTAMQIGEPVIFTRSGNETTTTAGSIMSSEFADKGFVSFFKKHDGEENITITKEGIPVKPEGIVGYIKSLLAENLDICSKEAELKIRNAEVTNDATLR